MIDLHEDSAAESLTYATSKLEAAAVLSAFYRHDVIRAHNLGSILAVTSPHGRCRT